jgi:hypothetical protein
MALVDPKDYQPKDPPVTQSDFLAAFKALLETMKTSAPADAERAAIEAERLLLEQERLKREMPENKQSPGISVYSYPEGDLLRPKPALKCKMFWVNRELTPETLTPLEIELLNKLEPGDYRVMKTDGVVIPFTVRAKRNDRLEIEELAVWFQCKDEHRHNHNSMTAYMQQALGERIPTVAELTAELARLKAELAAASVGAGRVN